MTSKRFNILIALFILLANTAGAQFRNRAALDSVKETGFYHIYITPELSSYLKTDLSDLRIVDENKQVVPFIADIPSNRKVLPTLLFEHKIIRKENVDSKTILIIDNGSKQELSNLQVGLKSAAAERAASLSGSDNNKDWFVVRDSLLLQNPGETNEAFHSQHIYFPPAGYLFFKLSINNGQKEPLNIVNIKSSYIPPIVDSVKTIFINPAPGFSQSDSGRYSLVKIMAERPYHITNIKFGISGPWLYKRPAKIFTKLQPALATTWFSQAHVEFLLSSDNFTGYQIPFLKADTFYLLIENGDNPPLKISSMSTEQVKRRVITQLEKDRSYSLLLNDPIAIAPTYDLQQFQDRIPASSSLDFKEIVSIPGLDIAEISRKQFKRWWIWPALIGVVAILSLLAFKLTTDMKKQDNV